MDEATAPYRLALTPQAIAALERELDWLAALVAARTTNYLQDSGPSPGFEDLEAPPAVEGEGPFVELLREHRLTTPERLLLILALTPHLRPQTLDTFLVQNPVHGRGFTEFGGIQGRQHGGFLPTGETALFLLAGDDLPARLAHVELFQREHRLYRLDLLDSSRPEPGEPPWSAPLAPTPTLLGRLLGGRTAGPRSKVRFPATRITTLMQWDDLILPPAVRAQIEELSGWTRHAKRIMKDWGLERVLRPGYRALFSGPSGTGKTLAATLLGKREGLDVYRIDLAAVVSKYIGETEKNLAALFDRATHQSWILFFDEAEALFGRSTQTTTAHDRYANQEVAYLLQRLEAFAGLAILATNLEGNIDGAFARRFQNVIYFPRPDGEHRLRLWQTLVWSTTRLEDSVDLSQFARDYELTGGQIVNVLRHAAIHAAMRKEEALRREDLLVGIRREFAKDGRGG